MDTISVTGDDAKIIEKQVESGRYRDASDVVSAGLKLLQELESEAEAWMRREIPRRVSEHDSDPSSAIPLDDVFAAINRQYRQDVQAKTRRK